MYIRPTALIVGDTIIDNKGQLIKVSTLETCPSHTKGICRVHVNNQDCYDGAAYITIQEEN